MKTIYRLLGILLLLLASIGCSQTITTAPDVTFSTITGQKIALKELRGKPVIVTFWATDCPSCVEEIPDLINLYKQFHYSGLEIIAVAMQYNPPNHVIDMTKDRQLPYKVALDLSSEVAEAFGGVMFTPSTFLIAADGTIIDKHIGIFNPDKMTSTINWLLKG
jgi:peroxiredoxin